MKLIEKAVKEKKLSENRIRKYWCPKDVGYNNIVQCKEGKYNCHNRTCWDIEI